MWLWILSALLIALAWGAWFFLNPAAPRPELVPIWIPVVVTALVILTLVGIIVFRRIRAARAARALEKAIAQQAQEQALAAKPERAAEIQELHKQIQQGINALKASKLGGGSGADALYSAALVRDGRPARRRQDHRAPSLRPRLPLPRSQRRRRARRGRHAQLRLVVHERRHPPRHGGPLHHRERRPRRVDGLLERAAQVPHEKPINGVIVAVSISELLDASEDQIQQTAKNVRARIDEMQETLKMVVPVYVMFTKIDLVAGFTEFFGDLKKSERGQPWGATFRLNADKAEPGKLFDGEFDTLVESLHTRSLKRMTLERSRDTKEKVYQFPLEFAAIKRNLSDFLAAAFGPRAEEPAPAKVEKGKKAPKPRAPMAPPILRGFYFTSGVQEGKPLDRVVGAMGRAFGLRGAVSEESAEKTESKSFFLKDVFTGIIFPDKDIAARTEAEVNRLRAQRFLVAAAAAMLALLFLIPSVISFFNNRKLVNDTARVSKEAAEVNWVDNGPPVEKVDKLENLLHHAEHLDQLSRDRPVDYTFLMFQADKLFEPAKEQYIASLKQGFVDPTRRAMEDRLGAARGANYVEDFDTLKMYLLLADDKIYRVHLEDEDVASWEVDHLTKAWAKNLRSVNTSVSEEDLVQKLKPHVRYYVDLLRRGKIKGEVIDAALVERVRVDLRRVGAALINYDRFVTSLIDRRIDPAKPPTPDNLQFPPITLAQIFADRSDVLRKVHSYTEKQNPGKWFEVRGPYTYRGHKEVLASLDGGAAVIERELWVVPPDVEESNRATWIKRQLDQVRQDYDLKYILEWTKFFKDITVEIPNTNREAIEEFKILSTPDWPYQRLLRVLFENTQFDEIDNSGLLDDAEVDGGVVDQLKQKAQQRLQRRTTVQLNPIFRGLAQKPGERPDPVPLAFNSMVHFGVPALPPKPKDDTPPPPPQPVELGTYVGKLQELSGEMGNVEDGPANPDTKKATEKFEEAVRTTEGLILKMDDTGQALMTDMLMNPLRQAYKAVMKHAGGAASGLWEVVVYPTYKDKIKDRYPFNLASTRDASFQDAVLFFKPKDGVLWGFYDQYLKPFHTKQNHDFIPEAHLEARPRPAKPFSPFNPNMYNCLKRADEITDALWGEGTGEKPQVSFQINVKTVSPIVSDVIFELDGQKRVYRNEKEFWHPFTWPGPKPLGARIQVRGAGGLDEEILREGPWGLFRLLEAGTVTAEKDNDQVFTVTWEMSAPPVSVTLEFKPLRANHPFPSSFFRATNCPSSIGDKFGKGGGKDAKGKG
jgi:type VI secretion system protein ImpL